MSIRILIIEDEILIARFLEHHLRTLYTKIKIEIALTIDEVNFIFHDFKPHVVLCDISLDDHFDGIELMKILKKKHSFYLIFITSLRAKSWLDKAFELMPDNYIIKPIDESTLFAGVQPIIQKISLAKKENYLLEKVIELTENEQTVLKLVGKGLDSKEISEKLYLSYSTIKNIRHKICRKLDLKEENNALLNWVIKHKNYIKHL